MQGRDRNRIVWKPSEHILPMRSLQRGSRIGGAVIMLFSAAWCGVLYTSIIMGTIQEGPDIPMTLFMLVFSLPGLLFFYMGLASMLGRTRITLSSDTVQVLHRRVGRARRWEEPVRNYTGVLRRATHHNPEDGASYTEYLVLLAHSDPQKEVRLFDARSSRLWESAWHGFSELLGLPLLDESELGIYQVGGEKPEHSASAPADGDIVKVDVRGIEVQPVSDGYTFRISGAYTAWRGVLGMAISGIIATGAWVMQARYPDDTLLVVFTWMMAGFGLISLGSLVNSLRSRNELIVTRDRVEYRTRGSTRTDLRKKSTTVLPTAAVRSVTLKADAVHRGLPAAVTIEGEDGSIRLVPWRGFRLKVELLRAIAAALGQVTGKGAGAFLPEMVLPGQRQSQRRAAVVLIGCMVAFFVVLIPLMWLAFHDRPPPKPPHRERDEAFRLWRSLAEAGYGDYLAGRDVQAMEKLERALVLAERLGDNNRALSATLYRLSQVVEHQGDIARAADLAQRSLNVSHARGDHGESIGRQTLRLAKLLEENGDTQAASARQEEAMRLFREAGVEPPAKRAPPPQTDQRVRAEAARRRATEEAAAKLAAHSSDSAPSPATSSEPKSPRKAEIVELELKAFHPQRNRVATYSDDAPLQLASEPPRALRGLPEGKGQLWYGQLTLGEKRDDYSFALEASRPQRLWLDRNRNGDLSDDGPPIESRGNGLFAAAVQVAVAPIKKPLSLWLFTNDRLWTERRLTFYNRTQLVSRPIIGGREYLVVIAERGRHDGSFDNDGIYVDINRNGEIEPSGEYIPPGRSVSLLGHRYRFELH